MKAPVALFAAAALLTGCAAGPDFQRPAPPAAGAYRTAPIEVSGQDLVSGAPVSAQWWRAFGSPALDGLVERALAANPNLAAARASLRSAQELAMAQRAALWPQASASLSPTRQRIGDKLSSPLNAPVNPFSLHTAQLSIAYAPDVFGGNRRATEALEAQAEVQRFELEAARISLATNVVTAAVQEAGLRDQIAAAEAAIAAQVSVLDLMRRQEALGDIGKAAVAAQEALLAQSRAALPPLRKQLGQTRNLLAALAGGFPDTGLTPAFHLADFHLPHELPLSLPSALVEQRPDVRAAEATLHVASAQVGSAAAARLPQFSIDAGIGSVATRLAELFKAGGGFWSIAGAVTQSIFDGGALRHRESAAQAAYDAAAAQYQATVIGAVQNVADTLYALEQDAQALGIAEDASRAASRSLAFAKRQFELGDVAWIAVLNAEQAGRQAEVALAQARTARYADTAALFQALGGGWWERPL